MFNLVAVTLSSFFLTAAGSATTGTQTNAPVPEDDKAEISEPVSETATDAQHARISVPLSVDLPKGRTPANFTAVRMYFAPVEVSADGRLQTIPTEGKRRYDTNDRGVPFRSRSKAAVVSLGALHADLPAGTYVLSEIRYKSSGTRGFESTGSQNGGAYGSGARNTSYCLTERTVAFTVEAGSDAAFGLVLANLPKNRAYEQDLNPVIEFDSLVEEDANGEELMIVSFDDKTGACSRDSHLTAPVTQLP